MNNHKKNLAVCLTFTVLLAAGCLLGLFLPKEDISYSERRRLAPLPVLSADTWFSGRFMSDFENYAADHVWRRDSFRTVKALVQTKLFGRLDENGIYAADGHLAAMEYPLREASLSRAAERFRLICDKYLSADNPVYLSVIPDKNCFLAPQSGHLSMDYAELEKRMAQKADFAEYIRISDLLETDDYYLTDPHWRQEKITDVAERLSQAMGASISKDYKKHTLDQEFYGVYYGQAALPFAPDTLCYLTTEATEGCRVYDWQNERQIPVYDQKLAAGRDPYEMFLSGSLSLITMENPDAPSKKRLVLFRDSFGSGIAPLLISGYSEITLADIRYIHPDTLEKFVDFTDCDVLFLYSTLVLNHSETLK